MKSILVRLVNHGDLLSRGIIEEQGGEIAHAEVFMPGTRSVIGAYAEGGVSERDWLYDNGVFEKEILVWLETDDERADAFHHYLRAVAAKREPYDFPGLAEFVALKDFHHQHWVFCSALVVDALRLNGAETASVVSPIFPRGLPKAAHEVSPVWLQEILFAREDVEVLEGRDDPRFIQHVEGSKE